MSGTVCRLTLLSFVTLFSVTSCQAQTLSNCRPAPDMPAEPKPGISGLTLTRDGKTLVVASGDARIRFIELATGQVRRVLAGHTNAVYTAVFDRDEKLLASSSRDGTARIWDVATGRELRRFGGFRCSVKTVAFSPDGQMLAASGNDGMVKLYQVKSGKELQSLVHNNSKEIDMSVYCVAFGSDGQKVYAANGDGSISEWDVTTGKESRSWKAHERAVLKLAFDPDCRLLATFGDSQVKLWDTKTWREVRALPVTRTTDSVSLPSALAFSHDGKLIAASNVGFDEKQTSYQYVQTLVWDTANGEKLLTLEGHKFDVNALVFSGDDHQLLTGSVDTTVKFWNLKNGLLANTLKLQPDQKRN